jgi:hypothetical protein
MAGHRSVLRFRNNARVFGIISPAKHNMFPLAKLAR